MLLKRLVKPQPVGPLGRAVREALSSVAVESRSDEILATALELTDDRQIPEDAIKAQQFVHGPLTLVVRRSLGADVADSIVENLTPILEMAASQVRLKSSGVQPSQPKITQKPASVTRAHVFVASSDSSLIEKLEGLYTNAGSVEKVPDLLSLLSSIERSLSKTIVVVIDCQTQSVDPASFATLLPVMPETCRVLLFRATSSLRTRLGLVCGDDPRWVDIASDASADDMASVISSLA